MTATLSIIPTDLKIGQQVDIESRTWPGINKPGGHATITKFHYETTNGSTTSDGNGGGGAPTKIDVKYVLGGTEKQIEITYVKPHVELVRGGRSRRVDKKMTVDSFITGEKENNGAGGGGKKRGNKRKAVGADNVDKSVQKKKKVVQKKNKNDGIAAAKIEDEQSKVVDDDDTKKKKTKPAPSKKEGKKKTTASASTNKTKSIASYFTSASSATVTATASSTTTTTSAKTKGPSKPREETTKKVKKTNPNNPPTTATKPKKPTTNNPKTVKYSPNSILAVRAAHAKSPTQSHIFGTKTIGFSNDTVVKDAQSLLEGSWISSSANVRGGGGGSKKKRRSVQESLFPEEDEGEDRKSAATTVVTTVASLPKKKVTPSSASGKKGGVSSSSSSNNNKDKSVQNHKTIQSLYKNECVKAKDFVSSMFGSATKIHGGEQMEEDGAASSPESCLELKMDSGRMDLFNSLLSEVMFKKGLESMDVDEMICSINTSSQRGETVKPFTLLEVKAFLQTLDSQNRIFVSWEEDNSGTIYTI